MRLNEIQIQKDEAYLNNDLEGWYKGLNRIYLSISFKLSDIEKETIDDGFKGAKDCFEKNKRKEASEYLHQLDFALIHLMDKYKMIFPKKLELPTGDEKMRRKFKDVNIDDDLNEQQF